MSFRPFILLALVSLACHPMPRAVHRSWKGVPADVLEKQPEFATLPATKQHLSDGSQIWTFQDCETTFATRSGSVVVPSETRCCNNRFLIVSDGWVKDYRREGACSPANRPSVP